MRIVRIALIALVALLPNALRAQEPAPETEAVDQKLSRILQAVERIEKSDTNPAPAAPAASAALGELEKQIGALRSEMERLKSAPAPAPDPATAASEPAPDALSALEKKLQDNINAVWIVAAAALVFFMQAGFCMLETGMVRAKNSINVSMKNFMDFCIATPAYLFVGFTLMFGISWNGIVGLGDFWLSDNNSTNFWAFWIFQVVFAGTATTIVSGAMAERTKFVGYAVFSLLFSAIIYPVIGHWAWGGAAEGFGFGSGKGWLAEMGFRDFAGSSVVHAAGGAAALAGIFILGPRVGRFGPDGKPRFLAPHNIPMVTLGAFILWLGWFGFNAGSTLVGDGSIGRVAANTTLAGAVGAVLAMISAWWHDGRPDPVVAINGALAGLVGITAGCAYVTPFSAVVIGCVAGLLTTLATIAMEKLRLDDVVGAVPVHLVNGIWGTLAVALFDETGFKLANLKVQAIGTFSIAAASFVGTWALLKLVDAVLGLRATDREQEDGLDFAEHSANAYADFQITARNS